jgi:hypothetical protein
VECHIAANIIKEQFAKNGIKVVDNLEDAGVAITFEGVWGWANLASVNDNLSYDDLGGKRYYKEQTGRYVSVIKLAPVKGKGEDLLGLSVIDSSIDDGKFSNTNDIKFENLSPGINSRLQLRMFVDYWIAAFVQK